MDAQEPIRRAARGEAGSAYIVALMALVILTILGLALAFITQTEVQIGANEKTASRIFYAADAGIEVAAAQALASNRYTPTTILLNQTTVGYDAQAADRVRISQITPVLRALCNWCPQNYQGMPKFYSVHNALTATSQRITWTGSGDPPEDASLLGQKTLSVMYEFSPMPEPPVDAARDNEALEQVKF
ncbi:MAG TPA: PilX N-terminal domain-containing pilus assembly protein [Thermoanaerobaculia bacterium]|nr:PilX N-terminal domain-containing pilus assembly protein [Thermoanaerobaculia bacterium]HSK77082.1 PilX N-terminal domain-containing pilus assembly protein [Thermoanaerobaculia bacterium]